MIGKDKIILASGILLLVSGGLPSSAKEVGPGVFSCEVAKVSSRFLKDIALANEKIEHLFDAVDFPMSGRTEVSWTPGFNGEVSDPQITSSCGDPAVDLACVEAVLSASPEGARMRLAERRHMVFTSKTKSVQNSGKRQFLRDNVQDRTQYLVYIIPLSVCSRYPKLFSESELQTADNVAPLKASTMHEAQHKMLKFFESWSNFFRDHPNPSRKAIKQNAVKSVSEVLLGKDEKVPPQG
jgi:hypothetical protein